MGRAGVIDEGCHHGCIGYRGRSEWCLGSRTAEGVGGVPAVTGVIWLLCARPRMLESAIQRMQQGRWRRVPKDAEVGSGCWHARPGFI